jgi:hypothetical protein
VPHSEDPQLSGFVIFAAQTLKVSAGRVRFLGLPVFASVSRWLSLRLPTRADLLCSQPEVTEKVRPQKIHRETNAK